MCSHNSAMHGRRERRGTIITTTIIIMQLCKLL
jgi:hypothetical protein